MSSHCPLNGPGEEAADASPASHIPAWGLETGPLWEGPRAVYSEHRTVSSYEAGQVGAQPRRLLEFSLGRAEDTLWAAGFSL